MKNKKPIPQKFKIEKFLDHRGSIMRINNSFKKYKFKNEIISHSKKNVLRGLHYTKYFENKLIYVIKGKILDFCIEFKNNEPKKIYRFILKSGEGLFIPKGYIHGYLCKAKENILFYKLSSNYNYKLQRGFIWNDPYLNLKWGIKKPILSKKDRSLKKI